MYSSVYPPGMGATHFIATVAGYETAYRLLLTGDVINGREAKELRLCTQTAPDGDSCVRAAMVLAARVASQAPIAVRSTVFSLRAKQDRDLDLALRRCALMSIFLIIRFGVVCQVQLRVAISPDFGQVSHLPMTIMQR